MFPFTLERADEANEALRLGAVDAAGVDDHGRAPRQYLAGGTQLLDLMKLDVMRPTALIDINALQSRFGAIEADDAGLRLGALVRMPDAAEHRVVQRDYPVLHEALAQAASAQLRNMASLAGNVLQRTRCNYFRDPSWASCNKRTPGSGCAALGGVNRRLAVLGVSEHCIAHYPGDFGVALAALDAGIEILGPDGAAQTMPFGRLHREWGDTPHIETNLAPGALITGFRVPAGPWTRRSTYVKVRDRDSYDFALASAAVALDVGDDGMVRTARVAVGGLAARPWRAPEAEAALTGRALTEAAAREAAEIVFAGAVTHGETAFKPELGRRTVVRALLEAARMEL